MKIKTGFSRCLTAIILLLTVITTAAGQTSVPSYYVREKHFDEALWSIIVELNLDSAFDVGEDNREHISFSVIDLTAEKPVFGGVHHDNFIYPASVYKMYVGMEVLKQAYAGKFSLYDQYVVSSPNDVDVTKEIGYDPRPLLTHGDTVTIHYLLDLMITRSDNSAANCLIDVAGRPDINLTMLQNNWGGSEVTRKFLKRSVEDPGYASIRGTETCALHAADFMYRIHTRTLINPWVSMRMQSLLGLQLDTTKVSRGLPANAMFYHKTGWWSFYTHDTGIVDDGKVKYIISVFLPMPENNARPRLKMLAEKVHELMLSRH